MLKSLPTLYKLSSSGKLQSWTIGTRSSLIITTWGQVGGKMQTTQDRVKEGKNLGRSNATTPEQQAVAEAKSTWDKKLKSGYARTAEDAKAGKVHVSIEGGIWPMLAHTYSKHGNKITWPAYLQPKLNGHRCVATVDAQGVCTLWSRTRRCIQSLPHVVEGVEKLGLRSIILDGELYNHEFRQEFEALTSMIKRDGIKPESAKYIQYHIYDIVTSDPFSSRTAYLNSMVFGAKHDPNGPLHRVDTVEVADEVAAMEQFHEYLNQGYEGAMVRTADGLYESVSATHRSYGLQKIKVFEDAEFLIVGVNEGRGKLEGHAIFVCETADHVRFDAKAKGPISELKQYWQKPELAIGKMLTVQFQGYTKKSNVPLFPVALQFRTDL